MLNKLETQILELIRRNSTSLPEDVSRVLTGGAENEDAASKAAFALNLIEHNIQLAQTVSLPVCQDTGYLSFYLKLPKTADVDAIQNAIRKGVAAATEKGYLRQNSVDTLTGKNSGTNLGVGTPCFHVDFHEKSNYDIRLIQKGGGCENMSVQYALPCQFGSQYAGRNLNGVRACVLAAVNRAQGMGCAPGFLGVGVGGDRASGYALAKKQLLRRMDDDNPVPELADLEAEVVKEANQSGIGPMGFGGAFTIGGCKIGIQNRLPASYFVTIAYMCWAFRRQGVILNEWMDVEEWLYPSESAEAYKNRQSPDLSVQIMNSDEVRVHHLKTPLTEGDIQKLTVGDQVYLNGVIFTGRDAVHHYLYHGGKLGCIEGGILYHCGPVVQKKGDSWQVLAAGPTTSIREEPYQAEIIKKFKLKAVIGKGGMGEKTLNACKKQGAVYLHAIGGAAQIYARCVKKVRHVYLEQFGSPEAVWELEVKDFPAVVTMDSQGNSLHEAVKMKSNAAFERTGG